METATISPGDLHTRREQGQAVDLLDVRTPVEFQEIHADSARNVPLDALDPTTVAASRSGPANQPLYVICRSGARARQACAKFMAAGCDNVVVVEGGTLAWAAAGLPVVRGKKAVSLERQVRIAAGTLVLLGTLLGFLIHPVFLALSGFVGAGLVFAGVTDTCGMGLLLARMPWNQFRGADSACAVPR